MKNLPDIDRMPLGRSILKNCRANASCVNCYVTLSINLPFFHGRNQARDNAQSPLSAQAVRTPAVGVHVVAAGKQFVHKETSMFFTVTSSVVKSSGCPFVNT